MSGVCPKRSIGFLFFLKRRIPDFVDGLADALGRVHFELPGNRSHLSLAQVFPIPCPVQRLLLVLPQPMVDSRFPFAQFALADIFFNVIGQI